MHTSLGIRITIWSIFISAILISIGASWANLYERLWWFDEAVHFSIAFLPLPCWL